MYLVKHTELSQPNDSELNSKEHDRFVVFLSFEEALELVLERGRLMQIESEKSQGGMLAVKWDYENVNKICEEIMEKYHCKISISNYNSKNQIVLSGDSNSLNIVEKTLDMNGILTTKLNVGAAFHSSHMEMASSAFSTLLSKINEKCSMRFHMIDKLLSYSKWKEALALKNVTYGNPEFINDSHYMDDTRLSISNPPLFME
jgi:malonyl CoA-acyl carrier protein transacylase